MSERQNRHLDLAILLAKIDKDISEYLTDHDTIYLENAWLKRIQNEIEKLYEFLGDD
jgi:hypothetical protein